MTAFLLAAAALTLTALALVLLPLLRNRAQPRVDTAASNLTILREQRAELDTELQSGLLDDAQHREAILELERRVLEEAKPREVRSSIGVRRASIIAVALFIPLGATALYWKLGVPEALEPQAEAMPHFTAEQVEQMVAGLAERMRKNPDDPKGWAILARSYYAMQRFPEAVAAYEQLLQRTPHTADLLTDYADALAMSRNRDLSGKARAALQKALELDPQHFKALALLGAEAYDRKDYRAAVGYWERMQPLVPSDSELGQQIASSIAEARGHYAPGSDKKTAATASTGVSGTVRLGASVTEIDPNDTVFVFARAAEGPKMPLAVRRFHVKDLPASFELKDSDSVGAPTKLSEQTTVVIGARISRSGSATPQSGDWEGLSAPVRPGAKAVQILIDRRHP